MSDQPPEGRLLGLIHAARSLTLANVAIIALLIALIVPLFVVWKLFSDPALLDRFLSSYRVVRMEGGCILREVAERGAPKQWSVSTGFAAGGNERWVIGVILEREPSEEQIVSHCATLLILVDALPHTVP